MMKRILMASVLVIGVVVSASAVQASHLAFSESFNYANASDGDALGAATGDRWEIAQQEGSERGDFDTTNLTYPGYYDGGGGSAVTSGNALSRISTDGADGTALKALDSTPGTYYASALINGNADWWFRTYKVLINHQKPTVQYQSADSAIYDTGVTKGSGPGGTDLLVVRVDIDGGGADIDNVRMVANPDLSLGLPQLMSDLGGATIITTDMSAGNNGPNQEYFQFSRGNSSSEVYIDEIRFGSSLDDVINTPEPTGLVLLVMGLVTMVGIRKRRTDR